MNPLIENNVNVTPRKTSTLRQYIWSRGNKKSGRNKVGVVIAIDKNKVGWSLCNKTDKFDMNVAEILATARAKTGVSRSFDVPNSVRKTYNAMVNRSNRYYKD